MQDLLLYLLVACLPLAIWSGYRLGKKSSAKSVSQLPNQYFAGLNYLLNEQPDKAIDVFIEQLQLDSEVVETHLALGNLFRRRGEVDRAIRIHQNLIARPSLSADIRKLALKELAHDYLAAGLYDRAENLFSELSTDPTHKKEALLNLISVYQQLHDWRQAIECAGKLGHISGVSNRKRITNYYCEIAQEAFDSGELKDGLEAVKKALNLDATGLRQNILLARHYMTQSDYRKALKIYQGIARSHSEFISEFLNDIHRCHIQLGTEQQFLSDLADYIKESQNLDALLLYTKLSRTISNQDRVIEVLEDFTQSSPSAGALVHLLANYREHAIEPDRGRYERLQSAMTTLARQNNKYGCTSCGYHSMTLFWQCPACQEWSTMQPLTGDANYTSEDSHEFE